MLLVAAACSSADSTADADPADEPAATTTTEAETAEADTSPTPDTEPGIDTGTGDSDDGETAANGTETSDGDSEPGTAETSPTPSEPEPNDTADTADDTSEPDDTAAGDAAQPEPDPAETPETDRDDSPEPEIRRTPGSAFHDAWYWDHAAIRALFPECPPADVAADSWVYRVRDYWDAAYAGWDLDVRLLPPDGTTVASGWWTDEQLDMAYPGLGDTAESAHSHARYDARLDTVYLWPVGGGGDLSVLGGMGVSYAPQLFDDGSYAFENLYRRLTAAGYTNPGSSDDLLPYVRDDGASGVNLPDTDVGALLGEWTITRYQYPPTVHEPAAWAMFTLLDARESGCVVEQMQAVCDSGDGEGLLTRDDRFGRVLWSLVCPDA